MQPIASNRKLRRTGSRGQHCDWECTLRPVAVGTLRPVAVGTSQSARGCRSQSALAVAMLPTATGAPQSYIGSNRLRDPGLLHKTLPNQELNKNASLCVWKKVILRTGCVSILWCVRFWVFFLQTHSKAFFLAPGLVRFCDVILDHATYCIQ